MSRIAPRTSIGNRPHVVSIQTIGPEVPDGQGGFTRAPVTLASRISAEIKPATARALERVIANSVQSSASHLVTVPYVPGVTTGTQVVFHDVVDRTFSVSGVHDPDEQHVELILACEESGAA